MRVLDRGYVLHYGANKFNICHFFEGAGQRRKLRCRKLNVELAQLITELIWGDQDKSFETRMPRYLASETGWMDACASCQCFSIDLYSSMYPPSLQWRQVPVTNRLVFDREYGTIDETMQPKRLVNGQRTLNHLCEWWTIMVPAQFPAGPQTRSSLAGSVAPRPPPPSSRKASIQRKIGPFIL